MIDEYRNGDIQTEAVDFPADKCVLRVEDQRYGRRGHGRPDGSCQRWHGEGGRASTDAEEYLWVEAQVEPI